jgi:hypothetical protein
MRTVPPSALAQGPGLRPAKSGYSACRSQESAAEGVGLQRPGHRQDHERRSGVELGIRALPAGLHPANSPKSPESSGRQPLPVRQQEWAEGSKSPPSGLRPRATTASREEFARRLVPTAGRRVTMDKQLRWPVRRAEPDDRYGTRAERHRHARC